MLHKLLLLVLTFMFCCSSAFCKEMPYTKSKIPYEKKLQIYKYYCQMEDRYGLDSAYSKTAKKFKIPKDEVITIKTEGIMEDWLGEFKAPPSTKTKQQREKENIEFGAELYRQGEKIRKGQ